MTLNPFMNKFARFMITVARNVDIFSITENKLSI